MNASAAPADAPRDAKAARRERKVRWASRAGYVAVQLLARTWRIDLRGASNWPTVDGVRRPVVVAVWHGLMLAPIWTQRNRGIMALASEHGDGEIIARILERLGYAPPARGSSSRGGVRGLMTLVAALRAGHMAVQLLARTWRIDLRGESNWPSVDGVRRPQPAS